MFKIYTGTYGTWRLPMLFELRRDRQPGVIAGDIYFKFGTWRSPVSALDWGSRGREFKSPRSDKKDWYPQSFFISPSRGREFSRSPEPD